MMFSPKPPERLPHGVTPAVGAYLRRSAQQLEALSRYQGESISGGTMPTEVLPPLIWIFGQIRNEESDSSTSSSGSSSSGKFSYSPAGAGFTDEEGYLAFAFDQIYDDYPWKGKIIPNGIRTTMPNTTPGVGGANYAYPLNSDFFAAGTNVILKKAGNHWVIIGAVSGDSSSDPQEFFFDVDCEAGTIVVGDAPTTPPTTSSGSGGGTTPNPKKGGNESGIDGGITNATGGGTIP